VRVPFTGAHPERQCSHQDRAERDGDQDAACYVHAFMIAPARVKRKFIATSAGCAVGAFLCLLGCITPLDAALNRATARVVDACGLRPHARARLVPGPFRCGAVADAVGCANMSTGRVKVSDRLGTDALEQVLTHELLHLLGAGHVPAGQGIMGVSISASLDRVTRTDLEGLPCRWVRPE
jgi:hypothetical protein